MEAISGQLFHYLLGLRFKNGQDNKPVNRRRAHAYPYLPWILAKYNIHEASPWDNLRYNSGQSKYLGDSPLTISKDIGCFRIDWHEVIDGAALSNVAEEVEHAAYEEQLELAHIHQFKRKPIKRTRELTAAHLDVDKNSIPETLSQKEFGTEPKEPGGSPWEDSITSFLLIPAGVIFALFPYFFLQRYFAMTIYLTLGAMALFLTGAALIRMTDKSVWVSGFRQVLVGLLAAVVVFSLGEQIRVLVGR